MLIRRQRGARDAHRPHPSLTRQTIAHQHQQGQRQAVAAQPDRTRIGWASTAAESTREPYRSLAVELLTADFPALTEAEAATSTRSLARRLRVRAVDAEKNELLGAIQRVPADSEEGRAVRVALRDLDARRRTLTEEPA